MRALLEDSALEEAVLLRVADAFQQRTDHHLKRPSTFGASDV